MWWSLVYVLVVILNIINILFTDYCRMFSLQKNPACACEDDYKGDLFTCPVWLRNERGSSPDPLVMWVDCRAQRRRGTGEGRGPSPCINLYSYVSE